MENSLARHLGVLLRWGALASRRRLERFGLVDLSSSVGFVFGFFESQS